MKYAARLVTALAALVLLVGAIVGFSTKAQAATSPPADIAWVVSTDAPVMPVLSVDKGIGTELDTSLASVIERDTGSGKTFLFATTLDQTHEAWTTQVMTSTLATDIGTITAFVVVGLAAIAFTNATTLEYVRRFTQDMVTWLRTRRHHGAGAPTTRDGNSFGLRHVNDRNSSPKDGTVRTLTPPAQGFHPLRA